MQTLSIDHLNKSYGSHRVLHDMTFQVAPGEIYGFVGSNGAGKSTTMRIALGVLASDSGEVRIGERRINDDLRRRIGYMPEERGLYAKEKIADQLQFFAKLHGLDAERSRRNAEALLEQLGLAERADDKLEELSLGNQQRVQLAASLIHDPELLILDEPFSGLDPVAVNVMSELLVERAKQGVPVLFSSHQLDLVQRLCDRVGIIAAGEMKAEGTVAELRSRGALLYEVHTDARDWYPEGVSLVEETPEGVIVEAQSITQDQAILQAALTAGPVHSFTRRMPHLSELFQEVVES
ncbi:MAG TPA: ATP-binding cassette domain-containing protein [Candidatus Corynebacterium gallistercoris]|uniref:ATP-binding cassette domain-containing protein n=1 Tax=Candidatus Corynebacterium gallistercoris TaxID=2838530 RepID=A0A9D1US35_9CORY|nr:ATP-binding cassette domain-containing protein [Candidatus Corynebacterium gallistercoris]